MEHPVTGSVPIAVREDKNLKVTLPNGETEDIYYLEEDLDRAILLFYTAATTGSSAGSEFGKLVKQAFDSPKMNNSIVDTHFSNFTPLWSYHLHTGNLIAASNVWEQALSPALEWEQSRSQHVHKGTAFYFYAVTAILARDFDRGYLFLHRALEDDVFLAGPNPGTPAERVVLMDPDDKNQAFRNWVLTKAAVVNEALEIYQQKHQKQLDFPAFKSKFLSRPGLRASAFLFSYSIARRLNLKHSPTGTLASEFGSQLCLNLCFDLALIIDSAIPENTAVPEKSRWKFIHKANHLSNQAQLGLSLNQLQVINESFKKHPFGQTVEELLDQTFNHSGCQPIGLSAALALAYGCRNRGAHHIASARIVGDRFPDMFQVLMEILFLAVETFP